MVLWHRWLTVITLVVGMSIIGYLSVAATASTDISFGNLSFEEQDYPSVETYINLAVVDANPQTVDGNYVRVTVPVENTSETASYTVGLVVTEIVSGTVIHTETVNLTPGASTDVVFEWDTFGFAWSATNDPASERVIQASIANATATSDPFTVIVKPRPVIFVHGWNGNGQDANSGQWRAYAREDGYLKSTNPLWESRYVTDLDVGGLVTGFFTQGDSHRTNASIVATQLQEAREANNAWHVDMMAFSLGGLVARAYLHFLLPEEIDVKADDNRPAVVQTILLATPNAGSSCAAITTDSVFFNEAHYLSPEYMWYFNRIVTRSNGARIINVASSGVRTPDFNRQTCPIGSDLNYYAPVCNRVYNLVGLEGFGDGVVSLTSAFSIDAYANIQTTNPYTHNDKIDNDPRLGNSINLVEPVYIENILPQLAVGLDDIASFSLDTISPTSQPSSRAEQVTDPSAPIVQSLGNQTVLVPAGETAPMQVSVPSAISADFLVTSSSSDIAFAVTSPDGIQRTGESQTAALYNRINVPDPANGLWTVELSNTGSAEENVTVEVLVEIPFSQLLAERQADAIVTNSLGTASSDVFNNDVNQLDALGDKICMDPNLDGVISLADLDYMLSLIGGTRSDADIDWTGFVTPADSVFFINRVGDLIRDGNVVITLD